MNKNWCELFDGMSNFKLVCKLLAIFMNFSEVYRKNHDFTAGHTFSENWTYTYIYIEIMICSCIRFKIFTGSLLLKHTSFI